MGIRKIITALLPLLIFAVLIAFLWHGIGRDPHVLPSALLNKPAPTFTVNTVYKSQKTFSNQDLHGKISLVNVWATWCFVCKREHQVLDQIANQDVVTIYGLDYKDNRGKAIAWLSERGDPYQKIGFDATGRIAINWGVYGTPETFLVDQQGIIRYKHVGEMTMAIWQQDFLPLIAKLKHKGIVHE